MIVNIAIRRSIALSLFLATATAGAQQNVKLVVADGEGWTTAVTAKNDTAADAVLSISDCIDGPLVQVRLEPDAQVLVRDVAQFLCGLHGGFGLLDVPDIGRLESQVRHRDAFSCATSFYVIPALRRKLEKQHHSVRVPMVVNDDVEQAWVVVFGDPGPLTFEIFNEHGTLVQTEVADQREFISPWRLLVHPIARRIPIGTLVITEGDKTRPGLPVPPETYYGFVIIGARDGSSNYVRAW